jgi:hypothetical protein
MSNWFQIWNNCLQGGGNKVATLDCVPIVFSNLLSALLSFAATAAIILFLLGSFKFMRAGGDQKKLEGAKHTFSYAIIGFVIIVASFLIIKIISTVTGVECITKFGFLVCQ